ncbi:MAG: SDR family oxidoreductase [Dehalococcoidia bacterium]|nr:SDR family oxidoreductase [Dehalococcoidia bacterium]
MNTLRNKVCVITGAASGIGRATALLFAGEGAQVVAADINGVGAEETARRAMAAGGKAWAIAADLTDRAQAAAVVDGAMRRHGRIDVLHNNAGVVRLHETVEETPEDEWRWILETNLTSYFVLAKLAVPALRRGGGGVIINTASTAGLQASRDALAYAASKHGVVGLTRTLAVMLRTDGIRVNAVCPAGVDTPFLIPGPRLEERRRATGFLQPEEVALAVRHLALAENLTDALLMVQRVEGKAAYSLIEPWAAKPIALLE